MKDPKTLPHAVRGIFAVLSLTGFLFAPASLLADGEFVWDTATTVGAQNADGNWSGAAANWSVDGSDGTAPVVWTSGKIAWFGGGRNAQLAGSPAGTFTVTVDAAGVSAYNVRQLQLEGSAAADFVIQGGSLALTHAGGVRVDRGTLTIDAAITTAVTNMNLSAAAGATLLLTGSNTLGAQVSLGNGTGLTGVVKLANPGALGSSTVRMVSSSGQTLDINGLTVPNRIYVDSGRSARLVSSHPATDAVLTGNVTLNSVSSLLDAGAMAAGRSLEISGVISGPGKLGVPGNGHLVLSGANTYTGNTILGENGTLTLVETGSLTFALAGRNSGLVTGSGTAVFDGRFVIDVSGASPAGGGWQLVDATVAASYGPHFGLSLAGSPGADFTETTDGVWTCDGWTFVESTGLLSRGGSVGVYIDGDGNPHPWSVDRNHTLIWEGEPYIPFGGQFISRYLRHGSEGAYQDDVRILQAARAHGVEDIYLNSVWAGSVARTNRIIALFEESGFHYGLQLAQTATTAEPGYAVGAAGSVITVTAPGPVTYAPSAVTALPTGETMDAWYVVVETATGAVIDSGGITADNTGFVVNVATVPAGGAQVKFAIRSGTKRWIVADPAAQVAFLQTVNLGPNFRFLVDPVSNEYPAPRNFLPSSSVWRTAFATWLAGRYPGITALRDAWGLDPSSVASFGEAAVLVPLFSGETTSSWVEDGYAISDDTGTLHPVDMSVSRMWLDMCEARDDFLRQRVAAVCAALRAVVDVPIVAKRHGESSRVYINDPGVRGLDGLGMETYGTGTKLAYYNGVATYADVEQNPAPIWCLTTEYNASEWSNTWIAYQQRTTMYADLNRLLQMGSRGVFMFGIGLSSSNTDYNWTIFDLQHDPRQMEWLATFGRAARARRDDWLGVRPRLAHVFPVRNREASAFLLQSLPDYGLSGYWSGTTGIARFGSSHWAAPVFDPDGLPFVLHSQTVLDSPILAREAALLGFVPATDRAVANVKANPITVPAAWSSSFSSAPATPVPVSVSDVATDVQAVTWTDAEGRTQIRLMAKNTGAVTIRISSTAVAQGEVRVQQPGESAPSVVTLPVTIELPAAELELKDFILENVAMGRTRVEFSEVVGPSPEAAEVIGIAPADLVVEQL